MATQPNPTRSTENLTGRPDGVHESPSRVPPRCAVSPTRSASRDGDGRVAMEVQALATHYVPGQGERALMRAVLLDAVECLTGGQRSRARAQYALEARTWVEMRNAAWPFSFDNICAALDLDTERVRARLLSMPIDVMVSALRAPRVREEEVTAMIREGHPLRVVAAKFGISMPKVSVLSRGLASQLKAERDQRICTLRRQGWTIAALAQQFHLSLFRIRRICARAERIARAVAQRGGSGTDTATAMAALGGR